MNPSGAKKNTMIHNIAGATSQRGSPTALRLATFLLIAGCLSSLELRPSLVAQAGPLRVCDRDLELRHDVLRRVHRLVVSDRRWEEVLVSIDDAAVVVVRGVAR